MMHGLGPSPWRAAERRHVRRLSQLQTNSMKCFSQRPLLVGLLVGVPMCRCALTVGVMRGPRQNHGRGPGRSPEQHVDHYCLFWFPNLLGRCQWRRLLRRQLFSSVADPGVAVNSSETSNELLWTTYGGSLSERRHVQRLSQLQTNSMKSFAQRLAVAHGVLGTCLRTCRFPTTNIGRAVVSQRSTLVLTMDDFRCAKSCCLLKRGVD